MSEENKNIFVDNIKTLSEPDNFQKYVLGTKKNGQPRAIYDIVKDVTNIKKKKKGKKHKKKKHRKNSVPEAQISLYMSSKRRKKKKKHKKHWNINDY